METAITRLAKLQTASTAERQNRETNAVTVVSGNIQGTVVAQNAQGVTLRTQNGGEIRSAPTGQDFAVGQSLQLSTSNSGGIAEPSSNNVITPATPNLVTKVGVIRFRLEPPTPGQNFARSGDFWLDGSLDPVDGVPQGAFYAWVQELGAYVQIGGGQAAATAYNGMQIFVAKTGGFPSTGSGEFFDFNQTGLSADSGVVWDTNGYYNTTNSDRITLPQSGRYEAHLNVLLDHYIQGAEDVTSQWFVNMFLVDTDGTRLRALQRYFLYPADAGGLSRTYQEFNY